MRQIVFDTETTGLSAEAGHRVIEIGCVELVNRRLTGRHYHVYLQPDRDIDAGAQKVHGITAEFLADKPRFAEIAESFLKFIDKAEMIAHNANFDVTFLDHELQRYGKGWSSIGARCQVVDTLVLARKKFPGQKNTLDALCKRYAIDNSKRTLHGALLDAEILAMVYLAMTGEQYGLALAADKQESIDEIPSYADILKTAQSTTGDSLRERTVIRADDNELALHQAFLDSVIAGE